jgi:peptidoglycan/LPS O-acetylase OafA/YrhL
MPGLDGLRALAVTAVIVYHLNPSLLPGGYLGVDVFFVISGYLITGLLLAEYGQSGRISVRRFWARRARRLLPAVVVLLAGAVLLAAFFARDALGRLQLDVPASLFYVMNWRLVVQHQSYLGSFGRPPLLLHLWSLSVEEQFYLVWPIVIFLLRRRLSRQRIAVVALGGAAISAALMAVLFRAGNPSAVYFGTETHAEGLLIGAALAAAIPPGRMSATIGEAARRLLDRVGLAALAVVVAGFALFRFDSSFTYRGGMLLVDLATVVVVATVAHPASRLGPALARQPLRWVGLRSYSLYLWHWPIFEVVPSGAAFPSLFVRLGLTAGAAELSYRFVEQPWRTGRAQEALKAAVAGGRRRVLLSTVGGATVALTLILSTAPAPASPAILSEVSTPAARVTLAADSPGTIVSASGPLLAPLKPGKGLMLGSSPLTVPTPTTTDPPVDVSTPYGPVPASRLPILAIGDSVLLAASPALQATFGRSITIDAQVGRQVSSGLQRLADYKASGALARYRTVMIDLGTNGEFRTSDFAELVQLVAGVPLVVVYDVHAARPWAAPSDSTIDGGTARHPAQMRLVNWNRIAGGPNLLFPDGIHPNLAGSRLYSQLLVSALQPPRAVSTAAVKR